MADDQVKLTRLLYYTTGVAKSAIKDTALVGGSVGYKQAREILHNRFGNSHLVSQRIINDLKCGKSVNKPHELQQLSDELSMALVSLQKMCMLDEIDSQHCIIQILDRCPSYMRQQWKKKALGSKRQNGNYPKFADFVDFIREKASDFCDPVYGAEAIKLHKSSKSVVSNNVISETPSESTAFGATRPFKPARSCAMCNSNHGLFQCNTFKLLEPKMRSKFVKEKRLCFNCLCPGHFTRECRKNFRCTVQGCGKKHSKLIHVDEVSTPAETDDNPVPVSNGSISACEATVYLPMLTVLVNGKDVVALLENGSTNTFMTETLAKRLGVSGPRQSVAIKTLSDRVPSNPMIVSCHVSALDGSFVQCIDICVSDTVHPCQVPGNPSQSC